MPYTAGQSGHLAEHNILRPARAGGTTTVASPSVLHNVKDYGAVGNGVADDTTAVQAAITAASNSLYAGGVVHLPAGQYLITSTLTFPSGGVGGKFQGAGIDLTFVPVVLGSGTLGAKTVLVWGGTVGGTMMKQENEAGWEFSNFAFWGRATSGGTNRAGIGYHCNRNGGPVGTGVSVFRQVAWTDMVVGCQMGTAQATANCADFSWDTCQFVSVDTCLLIKNDNGVNYVFDSPSLGTCKRFIKAEYGGSVTVRQLNTATCGGTASDSWIFDFDTLGDNNGRVLIDGWRAEQTCKQLIRAQGGNGHVSVRGFEECQTDQNVTQVYSRGTSISFRDSRLATNDTTTPFFDIAWGGGSQRGALILENVQFSATTWAFAAWAKQTNANQIVPIRMRGCHYGNSGLPVKDIGNTLDWGDYTTATPTQTTDATASQLYFDGTLTETYTNTCPIPPDTTMLLDVLVVGQQIGGAGDAGAFHRRILVKNVAGTSAQVGATQTIGTDFNPGAWGGPGGFVEDAHDAWYTYVTGKAATTIKWTATVRPVARVDTA